MEKMTCWDPRIEKDVETDNPALVLGSFMPRLLFDPEHWRRIAWLADYCDEMVDPDDTGLPHPGDKGFEFVTGGSVVRSDDKYEIRTDRRITGPIYGDKT